MAATRIGPFIMQRPDDWRLDPLPCADRHHVVLNPMKMYDGRRHPVNLVRCSIGKPVHRERGRLAARIHPEWQAIQSTGGFAYEAATYPREYGHIGIAGCFEERKHLRRNLDAPQALMQTQRGSSSAPTRIEGAENEWPQVVHSRDAPMVITMRLANIVCRRMCPGAPPATAFGAPRNQLRMLRRADRRVAPPAEPERPGAFRPRPEARRRARRLRLTSSQA